MSSSKKRYQSPEEEEEKGEFFCELKFSTALFPWKDLIEG